MIQCGDPTAEFLYKKKNLNAALNKKSFKVFLLLKMFNFISPLIILFKLTAMRKALMKFFYTLLLIIPGLKTIAQTPDTITFDYKRDFKNILEKTQDKGSDLSYQKLLIRFLNRDTTLSNAETLALMIGFTEDPKYKPFEDMQAEKEIFELNDGGNIDEALIKAKTYLQTHPLSLKVLSEASFCYHSFKKEDSAVYYMDLVDKIMSAMIYSGTGKKPETPIFSLGLADGESFIPNIGMKVVNKDTDWNKNNQFMEIIDASKNVDDHINYFFIIQHAKEKIDDDRVNESSDKKDKKGFKHKKDKDKDKKNKKIKPADNTAPAATQ